MKRREFLGVLSGAAFLRSTPAFAQQARKIHRIGVLWHGANAEEEAIYLAALREGLRDSGYVEGQNIVLEMRFPAEQYERFFVLATELAQQNPDVLVSAAGIAAAQAPGGAAATASSAATVSAEDAAAMRTVVQKYVDAREQGNVEGVTALFTADADQLVSTGAWRMNSRRHMSSMRSNNGKAGDVEAQ